LSPKLQISTCRLLAYAHLRTSLRLAVLINVWPGCGALAAKIEGSQASRHSSQRLRRNLRLSEEHSLAAMLGT
jgi:hypothetical protein